MDRSLPNIGDRKPACTVGFDAEGWLAAHQHALASHDMDMVRGLKMDIALDTIDCATQRAYTLRDGTRVDMATEREIRDSVCATTLHTPRDLRRAAAAANVYDAPAVCEVVRGDCLKAAIALKTERGLNPAVLNMASSRRPGGGYKTGAAAQEENIFRRSNYFQSLEDPRRIDRQRTWHYPLGPLCGIYSPSVIVFRGPEDEGYPFLEQPVRLDFIAVAAIARPTVHRLEDGTQRLSPSDADLMRAKIALILDIALAHGHDSVVLGAFGCGAFGNPPEHVALLFREVLSTDAYRCRFKRICFAIFGTLLCGRVSFVRPPFSAFFFAKKKKLDLARYKHFSSFFLRYVFVLTPFKLALSLSLSLSLFNFGNTLWDRHCRLCRRPQCTQSAQPTRQRRAILRRLWCTPRCPCRHRRRSRKRRHAGRPRHNPRASSPKSDNQAHQKRRSQAQPTRKICQEFCPFF